jgi:hypothetical protein
MTLGRVALLVAVVFIGVDGSPVTQAPVPGSWPNMLTPQLAPKARRPAGNLQAL